MATSEEEIAAKRAEIAARVAVARAQQEAASSDSSSRGGGGSSKKALSRKEKAKATLEEHSSGSGGKKALTKKQQAALLQMPRADLLRCQAREMCKNPEMVRRNNPEMRNLTDAQIREHAKEMERMASTPKGLDAMKQVHSMSASDRAALVQLQDGISGKIPRDRKWVDDTIRLVKAQPETLKALFKGKLGAKEEQVMHFVDYVVTLNDWSLRIAIQFIEWVNRVQGPAGEIYQKVDDATLGCARYLVLFLMLFIVFYVGKVVWYLLRLALSILISGYQWLSGGFATGPAADAESAIATTVEPGMSDEPGIKDSEAPFVDVEL